MENRALVPFKEKLRREIFTVLKRLSLVIGFSFLVVLILVVATAQYTQFRQGRSELQSHFATIEGESQELIKSLRNQDISAFMKGTVSERDMYRRAYEAMNQLPFRTDLSIYNADKQRLFTTRQSVLEGISDDSFVKIVLPSINNNTVNRVTSDHQGNRYLLRLSPIMSHQKTLGYLVLYIDAKDLEATLNSETVHYWLADRFDNYLVSNSNHSSTLYRHKVDTAYFNSFLRFEKGNLYMTAKESLTDNIWLYTSILALPVLPLVLVALIVSLLMILTLYASSRRLSRSISLHSSDAVEDLVVELDRIVGGYQMQLSITTDDEFGYLAKKINSLIETLQRIFQQSMKLEQEKTLYQRRMLEAQFNPHFLYNTLESIKILMHLDVNKAEKMILAMNRVLRYSVSNHRDYTSVEEDFTVLEDFLFVNATRFEGVSYSLAFPESLSGMRIPKLFLLPLVENALKYGMSDRSQLTITIRVRETSSRILFEVIDDGKGFSEQWLAQLPHYLKTSHYQHGLVNSYKRLEMLYSSCQLRIDKVSNKNNVQLSIEKRQVCIDSLL
ncbi:sensor histidine kinase [Streptococcus pneumoniae]|nr:sensor histidine kinase [Streptococcus pneumoniae]